MTYEEAWNELKRALYVRGEVMFYSAGDDPHSTYLLGLKTIETTLDQMKIIEKNIIKSELIKK